MIETKGIITALKKHGMRVEDIASRMNVGVTTVYRWGRGKVNPILSLRKRLAKLLAEVEARADREAK